MTRKPPLLGVSCVLRRHGRVLLVERAKAPFAGLWSLPGGRVEFGETLLRAVCREMMEETGLEPAMPQFHRLHEAIDAAAGVHAVIAVFVASIGDDSEPVAGDDARAVRFLDRDELRTFDREKRLTSGLLSIVEPLM